MKLLSRFSFVALFGLGSSWIQEVSETWRIFNLHKSHCIVTPPLFVVRESRGQKVVSACLSLQVFFPGDLC